jgi:hypothetical protein
MSGIRLPLVKVLALGRVVRTVAYLNTFALVAGAVLCYSLKGGLASRGILEYLGDLVLLEVMILFLVGGLSGVTASKGWHETMKVLALWRKQAGVPIPEDKEWTPERQRAAEANGVIYLTTGAIMVVELILLGLAWG